MEHIQPPSSLAAASHAQQQSTKRLAPSTSSLMSQSIKQQFAPLEPPLVQSNRLKPPWDERIRVWKAVVLLKVSLIMIIVVPLLLIAAPFLGAARFLRFKRAKVEESATRAVMMASSSRVSENGKSRRQYLRHISEILELTDSRHWLFTLRTFLLAVVAHGLRLRPFLRLVSTACVRCFSSHEIYVALRYFTPLDLHVQNMLLRGAWDADDHAFTTVACFALFSEAIGAALRSTEELPTGMAVAQPSLHSLRTAMAPACHAVSEALALSAERHAEAPPLYLPLTPNPSGRGVVTTPLAVAEPALAITLARLG